MRIILCLLGLVILLPSYATTTVNDGSTPSRSLIGQPTTTLLQRWGKPDYQITYQNGHSIFVYNQQRYKTDTGPTPPAIGVSNTGGRPVITVSPANNPGSRPQLAIICTVSFEVNKKGIIIRVQEKGAGCD